MSERDCRKCTVRTEDDSGRDFDCGSAMCKLFFCQHLPQTERGGQVVEKSNTKALAAVCRYYTKRAEPTAFKKAWRKHAHNNLLGLAGATFEGFKAGWQARGKVIREVFEPFAGGMSRKARNKIRIAIMER